MQKKHVVSLEDVIHREACLNVTLPFFKKATFKIALFNFLMYKLAECSSRLEITLLFTSFEISDEKLFVIVRYYASIRALYENVFRFYFIL
jgi:hypothetical protein